MRGQLLPSLHQRPHWQGLLDGSRQDEHGEVVLEEDALGEEIEDVALVLFLVGQVVEEAHEFWVEPRYMSSFWNLADGCVIVSLSAYLSFMEWIIHHS